MTTRFFTIGHSTHPIDGFVDLLELHAIGCLVDVRRVPASRRHPQFGRERLARQLDAHGIDYLWLGEQLGGLRDDPDPASPNVGWREPAFRAYADRLAHPDFQRELATLEARAKDAATAIMCAEGDPFRCHRQILADALLVRGATVEHVLPDGSLRTHELPTFAVVEDGRIRYGAQDAALPSPPRLPFP